MEHMGKNVKYRGGISGLRQLCFLALAAALFAVADSGRFLAVPVFGAFFSLRTAGLVLWTAFCLRLALAPFEARRAICGAACGLLMGIMTLLGLGYSLNLPLLVTPWRYAAALLAVSAIYAASAGAFLRLTARNRASGRAGFRGRPGSRRPWEAGSGAKRPGRSGASGSGLRLWLFLTFLTGCVYVPVFLAVYPGVYSYDASVQVLQCFGSLPLSTHHSLLHTWFLCGCLKAGLVLFDSAQAGLALHSVVQSAFMGGVFSAVLCRMRRRGAPWPFLLLSWVFLAVNPYLAVFSFVTTKDVLFGAFFLLTFDMAYDMTACPEGFFADRRRTALMWVCVLFMCLFRNQGIYVALFFFCLTGLYWGFQGRGRKKGEAASPAVKGREVKRLAVFTLTAAAAWYVLSGPVPALLGAEKGDMREMLSVPMQQLARVYHEAPDKLRGEERAYLEKLIDVNALNSYVRVNADPVKSGFRTEVLKEDPGRFLRVWASVGLRAPRVYLDSFFMGNWGYWYPGASQYWILYILFDGAFMEPDANILGIKRDSRLPGLEELLRRGTLTPAFESVPVLRFLLNQAFPFWLALLSLTAAVYRRRQQEALPLLLVIGYWGTLLLGPVTNLRYALPLIYCVPSMAERAIGLQAEPGDAFPSDRG